MSDERPEAFYDALAEDYHLIFADWEASSRARPTCARGLAIRTSVADLRTLDVGRFDAVICMDNALPTC